MSPACEATAATLHLRDSGHDRDHGGSGSDAGIIGGVARRSLLARLGSHPLGVWLVKHVVSPLDDLVVRTSHGRWRPPSSRFLPTLQLTMTGRRSGLPRTVPLVYVRTGEGFVVANARPAGERSNPWVHNLRAAGSASVRVDGETCAVVARELKTPELERWWPELVRVWPAFAQHFAATSERSVFLLTTDPADV
jgi:deazaflavin-dependent oxidoreductase (nitroreductase family)